MKEKKALIAMSGGVDSSVAALIMKEKGYSCIGATMKLFQPKEDSCNIKKSKTCCSLEDVEDARNVSYNLGIPYYVFNYTREFEEKVIDKFIDRYKKGETPNPCIDCNRYMKFDHLYQRAIELGCEKIVTGHYARIEYDEKADRYILKKGRDLNKDQSYVLYSLTQEQLSMLDFPLGDYDKEKIRELASSNDFLNADKKDSQDICFIPDGNHKKFIEEYTGKVLTDGIFKDLQGNVLGKHEGYYKYTIGQRKGLGISAKTPLFVIDINPETNEVIVDEEKHLFKSFLIADDFNWLSIKKPEEGRELLVKAKVRYRQIEQDAVVKVIEDSKVLVTFINPQRAITKGQAVVLYDEDKVVGGGTIIG